MEQQRTVRGRASFFLGMLYHNTIAWNEAVDSLCSAAMDGSTPYHELSAAVPRTVRCCPPYHEQKDPTTNWALLLNNVLFSCRSAKHVLLAKIFCRGGPCADGGLRSCTKEQYYHARKTS